MEERFDRTSFKRQSPDEASDTVLFWRKQSPAYRLRSAYHLSLRVYGYDPAHEPGLDRTVFSTRKHQSPTLE